MEIFHAVFTKEHNYLCGRLRAEYPSIPEDDLFEHARHIVAAQVAKIHTVSICTFTHKGRRKLSVSKGWPGFKDSDVRHMHLQMLTPRRAYMCHGAAQIAKIPALTCTSTPGDTKQLISRKCFVSRGGVRQVECLLPFQLISPKFLYGSLYGCW
jgi:hypothetical protein